MRRTSLFACNLRAVEFYQEILEFVSQSRCLLEILKEGQTGATLRLMEALFFKKKIITTNINVKEEPFYTPQNIFIIGERPNDELANFVKTAYDDSVDKYIDKYDVGCWLKNNHPRSSLLLMALFLKN